MYGWAYIYILLLTIKIITWDKMTASYSCYILTKEDADFNASYQMISIHKNGFMPKESLFLISFLFMYSKGP